MRVEIVLYSDLSSSERETLLGRITTVTCIPASLAALASGRGGGEGGRGGGGGGGGERGGGRGGLTSRDIGQEKHILRVHAELCGNLLIAGGLSFVTSEGVKMVTDELHGARHALLDKQ